MQNKYLIFLALIFTTLVNCSGGNNNSTPDNSNPDLSDFLEDGEELSGGALTVFNTTNDAFSQSAPDLDADGEIDFEVGDSFFTQPWVTAPASTQVRDGLGPLFNARACASCHARDGRAAPPASPEEDVVGLLFRLSLAGVDSNGAPQPHPEYGGQFQHQSILGAAAEGRVRVEYEEIPGTFDDGQAYSLRRPIYTFENLAYGSIGPETMVSPRIASVVMGLGLLEAIDEASILANEDIEDSNGDGISGKANQVWDVQAQQLRLGRFGWKAGQPSLEQQAAAAFVNDIGITNPLFGNETCTEVQEDCQDAITGVNEGENFEIEERLFSRVVFYTQTLAVPARRNWDDPQVLRGKQLFSEMNCTGCHVPKFETGSNPAVDVLANQIIFPYTDLLLHDMGEGLADNRPEFLANGQEWRTPPLWGIGLVERVNGHTFFLHDGRARNLTEAILWHGGEAESSKNQFKALSQEDREAVITFLESL